MHTVTLFCKGLSVIRRAETIYLCVISVKMWTQASFLDKINKVGDVEDKQDRSQDISLRDVPTQYD